MKKQKENNTSMDILANICELKEENLLQVEEEQKGKVLN